MRGACEWAELSPPGPEQRGFLRGHIQLPGLKWHQVSPEPTRQVLALAEQQPGLVVLPAHDPTAAQRLFDS